MRVVWTLPILFLGLLSLSAPARAQGAIALDSAPKVQAEFVPERKEIRQGYEPCHKVADGRSAASGGSLSDV